MPMRLARIEATRDDHVYVVDLADTSGAETRFQMRLDDEDGVRTGSAEPDPFGHWDGDAESIRIIVRAVWQFHEARHYRSVSD